MFDRRTRAPLVRLRESADGFLEFLSFFMVSRSWREDNIRCESSIFLLIRLSWLVLPLSSHSLYVTFLLIQAVGDLIDFSSQVLRLEGNGARKGV